MDIGRQKNKDVADINVGDKSISCGHENDTISRRAAIYIASGYCHPANIAQELAKLPPAEPQIIYCKDCAKHNKRIGDYEELPVGGKWIWKENACPLIEFRGKAQGHEFDYQFCAYGERRTE